MTDDTPSPAGPALPPFAPIPLRARHDGWTPVRQRAFIVALAETACVEEAANHVGLSRAAAYALRRRPDAAAFREAWDAALDVGVARLSDAAMARALHGVATPVFYQGEQIGERRRFDEKLTMFLLRYRDPRRYGAWNDREWYARHGIDADQTLGTALSRLPADPASGADVA